MSGDTLGDYSVCLLCPPRIPSWNTHFGYGDLVNHIKKQCVSPWGMRNLGFNHILIRHGVPDPVLGKHYAFDTNITPVYLNLVIIK